MNRTLWNSVVALTMFTPNAPHNSPAAHVPVGHVHGVVYDSLAMMNVPGAIVWIPGSTQSTVSDKEGRFDLDSVPAGKQPILFSAPSLDSLGLGTMGGAYEVRASGSTQIRLATPSFHTLWAAMCNGSTPVSSDSGIVWGTISDATTHVRQANAMTRFSWLDMHAVNKQVLVDDLTRNVRSDSTGSYYACGLPLDVDILTEAEGTHATSGVVQYGIGYRRVLRVDLLVSTEMVLPTPSTGAEQPTSTRLHGSSSMRGTIRDDKGLPRAGVEVRFSAIDSAVHTDANGQFAVNGLPAGTQMIEARAIGLDPRRTIVDVSGGSPAEVDMRMEAAYLATINVTASAVGTRMIEDFERRKKSGFGTVLEAKDFENKPDLTTVLRALPFASVGRYLGQTVVQFPSVRLAGGSGTCSPIVWMDGVRSSMEEASSLEVADLRAVESYPRGSEAPPQFVGLSQGCGVLLFWTKRGLR